MTSSTQRIHFTIGNYGIDLLSHLGSGEFGILYKGAHLEDKTPVAAKKLNYKSTGGRNVNEDTMIIAKKEVEIFQKLSGHKNILQLLHAEDDGENHWLILEYCDQGNLMTYLRNNKPLQATRLKIMEECAAPISFMHSLTPPIIHRDIKPENVLIKRENGMDRVKVTDFGLGKLYDSPTTGPLQLTMKTFGGSLFYMAPEFFLGDVSELRYKPSVDTFALGLLFYVVLMHDGSDSELKPMSVTVQNSRKLLPFGVEMSNAMKDNSHLPVLFEDTDCDSDVVKALKKTNHIYDTFYWLREDFYSESYYFFILPLQYKTKGSVSSCLPAYR